MAKRHGTMPFTLAPAAAATAPGALIANLRQHREVPMRRKQFATSMLGSFTIAAGLLFPIATTWAQAQPVQYTATFDGAGGGPGYGIVPV